MSVNSNNYIGTELVWTAYDSPDKLPLDKPLVFRRTDGSTLFGRVHKISNGVMLLVDGHFHFDMELEGTEWTCIDFIFVTD